MRFSALLLLTVLGLGSQAFARNVPQKVRSPEVVLTHESPWFTGPLLAPSGYVIPAGHVNFEPYVYAQQSTSHYDSHWNKVDVPTTWNIAIQPTLEIGITKWAQISLLPQWSFNKAPDSFDFVLDDLEVTIDFQLLKESPNSWHPAIKLSFREIFPVAPYDNLDPNKHGTDIGGNGTYSTGIGLIMSRLLQISGIHWIDIRFAFG